jgi:hypothetical protein
MDFPILAGIFFEDNMRQHETKEKHENTKKGETRIG